MTYLDVCPKGVISGRVLLLFAAVVGWLALYVAKDKGEHFNVWGVCVAGYTRVHRYISVCTHGCWRPEDSLKCHPSEAHLPPLSQGLSLAWNSSSRLG